MSTDLRAADPVAPSLFGGRRDADLIEAATATATALAKVLEDRNLYVVTGTDPRTGNERRHVLVEGWTLLGTMLGVTPVCVWTRRTDDGNGWEARVEARVADGRVISAAEAMCGRDETKWEEDDEFAIRSMAQTRATSKALRIPLGFVVTLAGFDATPAEEIEGRTKRDDQIATKNQLNYIESLRKRHDLTVDDLTRLIRERYDREPSEVSKAQASELIEEMRERKPDIPGDDEATARRNDADAAADLSGRLRKLATAEWTPSDTDEAESGNAAEERTVLLQAIAGAIADLDIPPDKVRSIIGVKEGTSVLDTLADMDILGLREAAERVDEFAAAVEDADRPAPDGGD